MSSSIVRKLNCRCVTTALTFIHNKQYLLAAQGPYISIYDVSNGTLLNTYQVLHSNKIHHIRIHPIFNQHKIYLLICFGGRQLSLSIFNPSTIKIDLLSNAMSFNDWILDAKVLTHKSNKILSDEENTFDLALAMMHNQILLYSITLSLQTITEEEEEKNTTAIITDKILIELSNITFTDTILNENTSLLYCLSFFGDTIQSLMVAAGDCFNQVLILFCE